VQHREAEFRQITVMFCDLVGSTQLSEKLDPEDLQKLIDAYRVECSAAIGRYGGEVARYFGDGVMAFFGGPVHTRMTPFVLFTPPGDCVRSYEDFRASYPELSSGCLLGSGCCR
jgi:Adenylate cyclase, family 3 (some proteins contain HAMP domain)